jgi:hypothetical protein
MLTDQQRSTLEQLRSALDDVLVETRAELVEHEGHVAELRARLNTARESRAVLQRWLTTEKID